MKYKVTHTTSYRYNEPVPLSHNLLHLRPRDTTSQTLLRSQINISPSPAARRERLDFFGNHVTWIALQEPHAIFKIESISELEVEGKTIRMESHPISWNNARDEVYTGADAREPLVKSYVFDSLHVQAAPALAEYAMPSFPPRRPLLAAVLDLTQRIYREFTFDNRVTVIGSPVLEVLANRRGVCQDFAQVEIGCLRSLGLPARYVSGYILTHPAPGRKRLIGCDASHAWVSVYVPGLGWVDFDPTNGVMPVNEHITIGWGRDYDDISPIKGVLLGGHRQSMEYGVDMHPIADPISPAGVEKLN